MMSDDRSIVAERQPITEHERAKMEREFEGGYTNMKKKAEVLEREIIALQTVAPVDDSEEMLEALRGILEGKMTSIVSTSPPRSVRELVRELQSEPSASQEELVIQDFDEVMQWVISEDPVASADEIRARLLKRSKVLGAALPEGLEGLAQTAMMHIEHELENLGKTYANHETMLGDPVSQIPRKNFLVTEDNYAWDMEELARSLELNKGVMRNPLTKDMFSPDDVRQILAHPLGQRLRPLKEEQSKLKSGVRQETIDRLARLSQVMLADQSPDAGPSMAAVDEFLVYEAALPAAEQTTLESLKVPATDRHTRQAYDYTISEAIQDAKANRTCFHKTGDFLGQAASYLRQS